MGKTLKLITGIVGILVLILQIAIPFIPAEVSGIAGTGASGYFGIVSNAEPLVLMIVVGTQFFLVTVLGVLVIVNLFLKKKE